MSQTKRARDFLREHPTANSREIAEAWGITWTESFGTLVSRARCTLRDPEGVKAREQEYRKFKKGLPKPTGPACDRQAAVLVDAIAAQFEPGMNWANTDKWHVAFVRPLEAFGGDVTAFNQPSNRRPVWNTEP
jgi:hypothetical protein